MSLRKAPKRKAAKKDKGTVSGSTSPYFDASVTSSRAKISRETPKEADDLGRNQMLSKGSKKLGKSFFDQQCIKLAKQLLGQVLVRHVNGKRLAGKIVETEAYVGAEDTASHTFNGRQTPSNKSMFLSPGHAYVYLTYGMYHCINITSNGSGEAVLLRALSPSLGEDAMTRFRSEASKRQNRQFKTKEVCNGPAKLCQALNIDRSMDGTDLTTSNTLWVESGDCVPDADIVSCPRIGIHSATKEWVEKPLRFYVRGEPCVSKRNRAVEEATDEKT
ncbi:putative 3-methyladenine DNA glycosylase [Diadema setosum]|uniref:putative 3-methyladenine DNA glycosylase n=1 Tax=Diadema setosum TaxID=31175 RepID=UPI003B3BD955